VTMNGLKAQRWSYRSRCRISRTQCPNPNLARRLGAQARLAVKEEDDLGVLRAL
jgi:hypothetical protein